MGNKYIKYTLCMKLYIFEKIYREEVIDIDTKQIILDATVKLMKTNKAKKLTVQKIIDEAHVSRATFYSFFADKFDVVNYYFQSYIENASNEEDNEAQMEMCAYQFIYDNKDYFINALKIEGQNSFKKFFYDYYYHFSKEMYLRNTNKKELSNEERIALDFYYMGSFYILEKWLMGGTKESPEYMARLTHKLMPSEYWKKK